MRQKRRVVLMRQTGSIWKKTAAAVLALTMLIGSATGVMASAKSKDDKNDKGNKGNSKIEFNLNFKDLNEQDWKWAYETIIRLSAQGVFTGYDDGNFKPKNNITRIEAIIAAVRLLGLEAEAKKPENMNAKLNFKDFDKLQKKYGAAVGYVTVALENDLFAETETSIQAEKPATRLWATVLLVKALKLDAEAKTKMDTQLPFRDANQIPAGSVGYVAVALEKKLIAGYSDNKFQPNKPVNRAELAALLGRVDEQLPNDQNAQMITGTIKVIAAGSLTVTNAVYADLSTPVDANVFIFRNNVKVPISALQVGDEVLMYTFQGKIVFIDVTKTAATNVQLMGSGKVSSFTFTQGTSSLSLTKEVNGVQQTTIYNVVPNVSIIGNNGVLTTNLNVIVKGVNNVVTVIEIQP
jgi:hypothetical protein